MSTSAQGGKLEKLELATDLNKNSPGDLSALNLNPALRARLTQRLHLRTYSPSSIAESPDVGDSTALENQLSRLKPHSILPSGIRLFNTPELADLNLAPARPLRIAFLTSIRDVGRDESVGREWVPGDPRTYLKGTIEYCLEAIKDERLGRIAEVVAIITDDMPKDLRGCDYAAHPDHPGRWIFPKHLRNQSGLLATELTFNVPSTFRSLPRNDIEGRKRLKFDFEDQVFDILTNTNADVLISDHFLARIENLISKDRFGLYGRVLNTHPGILHRDYPAQCPGEFSYHLAVQHARGFDNLPNQPAVPMAKPHFRAGATFHIVNEVIDAGPILCDGELTAVSPNDTPQQVGFNMYGTSKNPVFIEGIRHYAHSIYPLLRCAKIFEQ